MVFRCGLLAQNPPHKGPLDHETNIFAGMASGISSERCKAHKGFGLSRRVFGITICNNVMMIAKACDRTSSCGTVVRDQFISGSLQKPLSYETKKCYSVKRNLRWVGFTISSHFESLTTLSPPGPKPTSRTKLKDNSYVGSRVYR